MIGNTYFQRELLVIKMNKYRYIYHQKTRIFDGLIYFCLSKVLEKSIEHPPSKKNQTFVCISLF